MYDDIYRRREVDAVLAAFVPPELADPEVAALGGNGFLLRDDLERIEATLRSAIRPRGCGAPLIVELGCGAGGLARRMARRLPASILGLDVSPAAIEVARRAEPNEASSAEARFEVAEFARTGLSSNVADAVVSVDALYLADPPHAALVEARRILRSDGTLLMTAYTSEVHYPGSVRLQRDFRPLIEAAGFVLERSLDLTSTWRTVMRAQHRRRWEQRDAIRAQLGDRAERDLHISAAMIGADGRPSYLDQVERIELCARAIHEPVAP